jgi:hypothetical protein
MLNRALLLIKNAESLSVREIALRMKHIAAPQLSVGQTACQRSTVHSTIVNQMQLILVVEVPNVGARAV